jgi:hypothetical protein
MTTSQHPDADQTRRSDSRDGEDLTLLEVMGSVLAAGFGVQSKENKVRDFTRGKPVHFIIAGVAFTLALLVSLVVVVALVV